MRKILLTVVLFSALFAASAQNRLFVGGTAGIGYNQKVFTFHFIPQAGYEITDRWAVGAGLGFSLGSNFQYSTILGVAEPFVRFCAWHNDFFFVDVKAKARLGFTKVMRTCQIGLQPSLRFRINDHWDLAADLGFFGAEYLNGVGWLPAVGIDAVNAGVWVAYRF